MSDFDPNWPHGHICILGDGARREAKVRITDLAGEAPIAAEITFMGCRVSTWLFTKDGRFGSARLINRPAPEPVVVDIKWVTIQFASESVRDADGLPIRASVRVECEFISDGSTRASAGVIK